VSSHMFVALPPIVTYRASRLLQLSNLTEVETEYWWRVFEAEWVVMVFCRFCADMSQRRLMWRLPARARRGINEMGVEKLLIGSPYGLSTVRIWLRGHDVHSWTAKTMMYTIRGPTFNESALYENREEFVRQYIPELGPRGIPTRFSLPEPSMDAKFNPCDVDAEFEFTPDPPIRLSGPPAYANSLAQKSPAPDSPEYTGPPLEFLPTPPNGTYYSIGDEKHDSDGERAS
jgi:hypothetical protein